MEKTLLSVLYLCGAILFSGCATIFSGSHEAVRIDSAPQGAKVYLSKEYEDIHGNKTNKIEEFVGETPLDVTLNRYDKHTLTIKKEGYIPVSPPINRKFNPVSILNNIILFGWAIDIATGAMWKYSPTTYLITLEGINTK